MCGGALHNNSVSDEKHGFGGGVNVSKRHTDNSTNRNASYNTKRDAKPYAIVTDLAFPEEPRWHDGLLWFIDAGTQVIAVSERGDEMHRIELPARPAGIGWLPMGDLLVVVPERDCILRFASPSAEPTVHAELSAYQPAANGLAVRADGMTYVGLTGYRDLDDPVRPSGSILVLSSSGEVVAQTNVQLDFPNGIALSLDESTLFVPETFGERLSAFAVLNDGALSKHRLVARLPGSYPDGCCVDETGAVWLADATSSTVVKLSPTGDLLDAIEAPQRVYSCALGGEQGQTLFLTSAPDHEEQTRKQQKGVVFAVDLSA